MRTELKIGIIVAILLIVFLVIMMLVSPYKRPETISDWIAASDHQKSNHDERRDDHRRHWAGAENAVNQPVAAFNPTPIPASVPAAMPTCTSIPTPLPAPTVPNAPVLRCYDYFEFPNEGAFQVKTCSAPSSTESGLTSASKAGKPTRIFLQWFPVENVSSYKVYCSQGPAVSTTQGGHAKTWLVAGSSYYFESEPLDGNSCWSMVVTAVNKDGIESAPSATYTTCSV